MEKVKKYHCKLCGTINDLEKPHCSNCGGDLGLYGEIVWGYYDRDGQFVIGKPPVQPPPPDPPIPPKPFPWKKLAIVLCALIVVAAAFFLLKPDPGPDPDPTENALQEVTAPVTEATAPAAETTAPAAETTAPATAAISSEAVLPDFGAFANEAVTLKETKEYSFAVRYTYTASAVDLLGVFDEYRVLLEAGYPYGQMAYIETGDNGWTNINYAYSYSGNADVGTMGYEELGFENCSIRLAYCHHPESGNVVIYVDVVNEIQYVDNGDRTTVAPTSQKTTNEAVIPDFMTFAGDQVKELEQEQLDNRYSNRYVMRSDTQEDVFDEYRKLLENSYAYEQMGTSEYSSDWQYTYYWYRYTGPAEVAELTMKIQPEGTQIEDCNVWIVYCLHPETGTVNIYVGAANEILCKDNGDRAAGNSQ